MSDLYPVFLKLKQQKCLVVGGGEVAARKVQSLLACQADVYVISPQLHPPLSQFVAAGKIRAFQRPYQKEDLAGAKLVIVATEQKEVNQQVASHCAEKGILCNVVDEPELCDFFVPAVVKQGPLKIAISTSGQAPVFAKQIRVNLTEHFDEAYKIVIEMVGRARTELLEKVSDATKRRKKISSLQLEELVQLYRSGGKEALTQRINALLNLDA
ncbi:MAG: bifunctional precorrin-2 dehydrogenase/sirohydrochlorin ferrochelatase [Firmicutes bacterium]|nr:bifunctional precorrin-2 dehydrogenase/sirohydrochlorin ferrochelatase [Bacillota bacterium]